MLTAAVFALAGLIFVTSFNTAKGTDIRTDASMLKLSDLIQERNEKNKELDESTASVRGDVDALARRDGGSTKKRTPISRRWRSRPVPRSSAAPR